MTIICLPKFFVHGKLKTLQMIVYDAGLKSINCCMVFLFIHLCYVTVQHATHLSRNTKVRIARSLLVNIASKPNTMKNMITVWRTMSTMRTNHGSHHILVHHTITATNTIRKKNHSTRPPILCTRSRNVSKTLTQYSLRCSRINTI